MFKLISSSFFNASTISYSFLNGGQKSDLIVEQLRQYSDPKLIFMSRVGIFAIGSDGFVEDHSYIDAHISTILSTAKGTQYHPTVEIIDGDMIIHTFYSYDEIFLFGYIHGTIAIRQVIRSQ